MSQNPDLQLTTTKGALTRALAIGKVTASPDKTLALLNAINIGMTERGNVVVQSTDRYLLSRTDLRPKGDVLVTDTFKKFGVTLALDYVGLVQKWLTLVDKYADVTLVADSTGLTVSATAAPTLSGLAPITGEYPKIGRLVRPDEEVDYGILDRAGAVVLSTRNVAKLGTIAGYSGRHEPVLLRPGKKASNNDLVFRFHDGDRIITDGVIMGLRVGENDPGHQHGI